MTSNDDSKTAADSQESLLERPGPLRLTPRSRSAGYTPGALRLFFDENVSPRVARALRELGESCGGVGNDKKDWIRPGTKDPEIVHRAQRSGWAIVTRNHDMVALAVDGGVPFIWIDVRGAELDLFDFAMLVFAQIEGWAEILQNQPNHGVKVGRTGCAPMHNRAAFKEVEARIARRAAKQARSVRRRRRSETDEAHGRLDL